MLSWSTPAKSSIRRFGEPRTEEGLCLASCVLRRREHTPTGRLASCKIAGGAPSCRWRALVFTANSRLHGEPRTSVRGDDGRREETLSVILPPGTEVPGSPIPRIGAYSRIGAEAPAQDTRPKTQDPRRKTSRSGSTAQGARRKTQAHSRLGAEAPCSRLRTQDPRPL